MIENQKEVKNTYFLLLNQDEFIKIKVKKLIIFNQP